MVYKRLIPQFNKNTKISFKIKELFAAIIRLYFVRRRIWYFISISQKYFSIFVLPREHDKLIWKHRRTHTRGTQKNGCSEYSPTNNNKWQTNEEKLQTLKEPWQAHNTCQWCEKMIFIVLRNFHIKCIWGQWRTAIQRFSVLTQISICFAKNKLFQIIFFLQKKIVVNKLTRLDPKKVKKCELASTEVIFVWMKHKIHTSELIEIFTQFSYPN